MAVEIPPAQFASPPLQSYSVTQSCIVFPMRFALVVKAMLLKVVIIFVYWATFFVGVNAASYKSDS